MTDIEPERHRTPAWRPWLLAALALASAAAILAMSLAIPDRQPIVNGEGFLERSRMALTDPHFYTSIRPFTTDLLFKLYGSDIDRAVLGQTILHGVAWPFLGFCAAWAMRRMAVAILVLIVLSSVGLWWNVLGWTLVMRSESSCFSLFAVWLGWMILWAVGGRRWVLAPLAAVTLLFSFTRDNIPYLLLTTAVGVPALLALLDRSRAAARKATLAGFAVLALLVFGLQSLSVNRTVARYDAILPGTTLEFRTRYQFNLINVIFTRILPDADRTRWFAERGMPVPDPTLWSGQWASSNNWAVYAEDRYAPFRDYVLDRFRRDLAVYLLSHPDFAIGEPLAQARAIWSADLTSYAYPVDRTGQQGVLLVSRLWSGVAGAGWPVLPGGILAVLAAAAVLRRRAGAELALSASLLGGILVQALLIFHADSMEVERHTLIVALVSLVVLAFALATVVDRAPIKWNEKDS